MSPGGDRSRATSHCRRRSSRRVPSGGTSNTRAIGAARSMNRAGRGTETHVLRGLWVEPAVNARRSLVLRVVEDYFTSTMFYGRFNQFLSSALRFYGDK